MPWQECVERAGQHRHFGDRHLVRRIGRRDIADVGNAGLRQLQHVGRLAELLCRIMLERDGAVGALVDLFHPGLEDQLDEIVALRKRVRHAQANGFGDRGPAACASTVVAIKRPEPARARRSATIFPPKGSIVVLKIAAHKGNCPSRTALRLQRAGSTTPGREGPTQASTRAIKLTLQLARLQMPEINRP